MVLKSQKSSDNSEDLTTSFIIVNKSRLLFSKSSLQIRDRFLINLSKVDKDTVFRDTGFVTI